MERLVVFRLGLLVGLRGPGLIILVPVIERAIKVGLRTVTMDVPSQDVITKDNVSVKVNAVIYFKVVDAAKAIVQVENYLYATSQIAQTTLRSIIARHLAWNRMKLSPAEELKAVGGWRVRAEINGRLRDEGVLPMLQELAEHSPRIVVEQLLVSAQRGQTITLQVSVLVLPEDGQ